MFSTMIRNPPDPRGHYIVCLPDKAQLRIEMKDRSTAYELSYTVWMRKGIQIFCFCQAKRQNLEVSIRVRRRHLRFFTWPGQETLSLIVETDRQSFESRKDLERLMSEELKIVRKYGVYDLFHYGNFLDQWNNKREICESHDHRNRPVPPPWYRRHLGHNVPNEYDVFLDDLHIDTLFRDQEEGAAGDEDGREESPAVADDKGGPTDHGGEPDQQGDAGHLREAGDGS